MKKIKILHGNCIDKIKELDDNSIDCVVSSPPYFGLRDYGTAQWKGGNPNCSHAYGRNTRGGLSDFQKNNKGSFGDEAVKSGECCKLCGAKRIDEQFGLEKTYQDYLANTVKVFETFKPKLKDTATIWWNVGDSYSSGKRTSTTNQSLRGNKNYGVTRTPVQNGIKEKDLLMIPNRVAIALQDAGWYIRSEIIWHKPNPMPESVKDRPTSCHEKIWLITKSKKYYYDADAIREPLAASSLNRLNQDIKNQKGSTRGNGGMKSNGNMKAVGNKETKNKRNVWTVTTKPCKEAHFATFPKDLIEPCIKAGCPEGGLVLDPFGGSGTTGIVAAQNNRNAVLIELNQKYIDIAKKRIDKELGLFNK
jgi:DNA modification methylase